VPLFGGEFTKKREDPTDLVYCNYTAGKEP